MKLDYFAHPYTVLKTDGTHDWEAEKANFILCCSRTAKLFQIGYFVFSPICHSHPIEAYERYLRDWNLWMQLDQLILQHTKFDRLILAPGWCDSKGCCNEKNWFQELKKEILFYSDIIAEVKCHEF